MTCRRLLLLLLLACGGWGRTGEPELPVGEVLPRVPCRAKPAFTYALYLPRDWKPGEVRPVLLGFSPQGQGEEPVRRFRRAADELGWILVGSNDSRNGPLAPALAAQEALWAEVQARFRPDPRRTFATGFSGGARMAVRLVRAHPGKVAGVAAFGAFFIDEAHTLHGLGGPAYFLACGMEDFNFAELREAREALAGRRLPAWAETFPGPHRWPPEDVALRAARFLEARSRGEVPPILEEGRVMARALEAGGEALQAQRLWEEVAAWSANPADREAARRAGAAPAARRELELEVRYRARHQDHDALRPTPKWGAAASALSATAHGPDPLEARQAWRILWDDLLILEVQGSEALERKDGPTAEQRFAAMVLLAPEVPRHRVLLAAALVAQGRSVEALVRLREAVASGYRPRQILATSEAFAPLRGTAGFEQLLAELPERP